MHVYLDHNATTPMAPGVVDVMVEVMRTVGGNPNSVHRAGVEARYVIEKARRSLARMLGIPDPGLLVYTSGGSEANNLALRGAAFAARRRGSGRHIIVSAAEHKAVLDTARALEALHGFELSIAPVDNKARIDMEALAALLRRDTILVSVIAANNEVGTLNDIPALARLVHERSGALFHTDAVQWIGRLPLNVEEWGADLVTLAAHKMHGPKGIGALYRRHGVELEPQITGGSQEGGLRAGTENPSLVAGFTEALRLALENQVGECRRLEELRELFWRELADAVPGIVRNSPAGGCLANTLNVSVPGLAGQRVVAELDRAGFAVSAGSACTSTGETTSHVVTAMGADEARAAGTIRISLGGSTGPEHAKAFARAVADVSARFQ